MPQWTIKSVSNEPICTVKSVERHGQLMSGRWLTVDIDSPIALPLSAGCYIDFNNVRYSIRSQADVEKSARPQSNGGAFTYKDLRLDDVSWQELEDTQMCDYVYGDNHLHYSGLGTFSFFAVNASDVGYRVLANLANKYGDSAWDVRINGSSIKSDYADYTFDEAKSIGISSGTNVKETLDLLWSNWGVYYTVENHVVDIITSSSGVSIPLRYGKNNGLKSIRRKINPNVEICTRVRAYGSERNMPYKWYNNKYPLVFGAAMYVPQLMLPHYAYVQNGEFIDANGDLYTSGTQVNLWSNPSDIVLPSKSEILTKYGKRDKEVHWNSDDMGEIFPSMKGMTKSEVGVDDSWVWNESDGRLDKLLSTAVNEDGTTITGTGDTSELTTGKINFKVRVPNPGFDPMSQKGQEDVVLLMQSGMCQSRGFVILKSEAVTDNEQVVAYDLTCVKAIDDEIDQVFPNGTYTIEGGQEYVYTGLTFSGNDLSNSWLAVYIGAAEKRLLRAAALWLREHQTEQYVFEITPDNVYLQRKKDEAEESNEEFDIIEGDTISLSQDDLGDSDEVVETVTVVYGKEAIPTYEITFLKRDESESLGDRVKGLVGQTISVDSDIAKMNDSLYRKVNKAGFHTLFDPLDAQYNVLDINGDLSTLRYIRANVDFFGVSGVTALGRSSGGGGGGVSSLSELSDVNISSPIDGQGLVYDSSTQKWVNGTVGGGGGGGISLADVWTSLAANNTSNKIHFSHLPNTIHVVDALHVDQSGHLENYNGAIFDLPSHSYRSTPYTLATTEDIQNIDLTDYALRSWVEGKNYLTGNQTITLSGDVSGSGTTTITTTIGTGRVTNAMLAGNIANSKLLYSRITIGNTSVSLGGTLSASALLNDLDDTFDGRYVTRGTEQEITASKTFKSTASLTVEASLTASNDIYLNKEYNQQWVNFNNKTKNFSFGQASGGDCVLYAAGNVNFYTNINSNPYALFVQGSSGNVGIGNNDPTYKFDVSGYINTTTGYYLDGKLMADSNNGLNIGYGFAAAATPLSTTIWGEGITFRSTDGTNNYTYGGCTKIDDTHGNITYGIMGTDFIGVTNKFRFEYDLQNNTVWVLKADGTAVNFASLGGVTSLGVGSSGTPNISSMNIATLTSTTVNATTLNNSVIKPIGGIGPTIEAPYIDGNDEEETYGVVFNYNTRSSHYLTDFYNIGLLGEDADENETWSIEPNGSAVFASASVGSLKVGSSGSSVSKMLWDGTYLQVTIGTKIYKFIPDQTSNA